MTNRATPNNSRYIPFTQQKYCCVPTAMLMIMHRNQIPLLPAEELGVYFGLTVPPEDENLFYNVKVSATPPSGAGYGTSIKNNDPNEVFAKLGIPLAVSFVLADKIFSTDDLIQKLLEIEKSDEDAIICLNDGVTFGEFKPFSGHAVIFDRIIDGKIRVVDPGTSRAKWRTLDAKIVFDAIQTHGVKHHGGIWKFIRKGTI